MKAIFTENAPQAVGPYSPAVVHGDLIFCSGQVGIEPESGDLLEGIEKQTNQVMKNLEQVLMEAGGSLSNIVKTTIFLANMNDYVKVNEIYGSYFVDIKPARSTVQVAQLPKNALIEIECIAVK